MKKLGAIFIVLLHFCVFAQTGNVGDFPEIKYARLNPETGLLELAWYASKTPNVNELIITAFINDIQSKDLVFLNPSVLEYTFTEAQMQDIDVTKPIELFVSVDVGGTVPVYSDSIYKTGFLSYSYEQCSKYITLNLDAEFDGPDIEIYSTAVWGKIGDKPYELIIESIKLNEPLDVEIAGTEEQKYYVEMRHYDKNFERWSTFTNVVTITPGIKGDVPDYMYANYCDAVSDDELALKFTVDKTSDIEEFVLYEKTHIDSQFSRVDTSIATIRFDEDSVFCNLLSDSIALQQHYFALVGIDECRDSVIATDITSNIVAKVEDTDDQIFIFRNVVTWSEYFDLGEDLPSYTVERYNGTYEKDILVDATSSAYVIDMYEETIERNEYVGNLCYTIFAFGTVDSIPNQLKAVSNTVCTKRPSRVFVPNSFNPYSSVPNNRIFKPVGIVNDQEYYFVIYNRLGNVVYETDDRNEGWDGMYDNKYALQGTYIYYLKYLDNYSEVIEKNGSVNLLLMDPEY